MNSNTFPFRHPIRAVAVTTAAFLITSASRGADLIDNDFGGGADTGPAFQQLYNGQGTASADPATGAITTTGVDNAAIGLNTTATVDASGASGFTIEWVVSSFTGDSFNDGSGSRVRFNGWFFGVTTNTGNAGPALWNNTGEAVGILLDGGNSFTDWSFVQRAGGSLDANTPLNGSQPTLASFNDGFTLSLTINADDTWSASSTGLSNDISASGSLAAGTYATIAGSLVANTTIQGTQVGYVLDQVTLSTGTGTPADTTPPTPAQMTWQSPPAADSDTVISMTAVTASDDSGVEYQFTRWFDGAVHFTSDWQSSPSFTDNGLAPSTTYGYTVQARDLSANQNSNTASSPIAEATTEEASGSGGLLLVDHTFDGVANDTGGLTFQQFSNGIGSGYAADPSTGIIDVGIANNNLTGFNHATPLDLAALDPTSVGFKVTYHVSGTTADVSALLYQGLYFGVTSGPTATDPDVDAAWHQAPDSFGYLAGGNSYGDNVIVEGDGSSDAETVSSLQAPAPSDASFSDGFTVTLVLRNDDTWTVTSTGLSNDLNASGSLTGGYFSYADLANGLVLNTSLQGQENATCTLSRMTLETISSDTSGDNTPPTPAQMSWANSPSALSETEIIMTAVTANDDNGVQYQFTRWFDGSVQFTSDWQSTPGFIDSGLLPATTYGYTVVARDRSVNENTNTPSSPVAEATTNDEGTDPPPNGGYVAPFVDSDGDSYRDEAETALGSNPNDPTDCPDHTPAPAKPNIVIIYADDLGFGDISRYGNLFGTPSASPTPNVDSLADQGVTFTQAHSANAVCTPSRYSLLTGIYNWRNFQSISGHYGFKAGIDNIPLDNDVTIAEFLKTQGYDTAAFGKWHLGGKWYAPGTNNRITGNPTDPTAVDWTRRIEGHATDIGFDYFRGLGTVLNFGPYVYLHDDIVHYWVEDTALNEYGNKLPNGRQGYFRPATAGDSFQWFTGSQLNSTVVGATDSRESLGDPSYRQIDAGPIMIADFERYIDERVAASDSDPFFAYVSLYSPHKPWAITPAFNNSTYGDYDYARWMAEVDDRIGRIIAAIDDNGMANDTLVIFTADNGPETTAMINTLANGDDANGPLRGAKRDVWDGGTRVPFIVRWPGQAPAGMVVTDELISQVDIFPTIAAFLGEELPDTTAPDGESFLNVVRGQRKPGEARGGIVLCSFGGHLALKAPDGWKLIDSTGGGGNTSSWDSENNTIPSAYGSDQGAPKQLFEMPVDLGEDINRIDSLTGDSAIRAELVSLTGRDLLATLDQLRSSGAAALDGREPDNDADGMSNAFETLHGLDRDSPKDAALDNDGDGADNLSESIAGTDPNDRGSVFRVIDLTDSPASLSVTWPSVSGRDYEVFWSTDLGTWTSDSTHPGTGGEITLSLDKAAIDAADGNSGNLRSLFVRISVTRRDGDDTSHESW
mgnify:CR=1 FL=1